MSQVIASVRQFECWLQEGDLFIEAKSWPPSAHITVQCDGCQKLIREGLFYHNMEMKSSSFDLCPQCFKSEFEPTFTSCLLLFSCRWEWFATRQPLSRPALPNNGVRAIFMSNFISPPLFAVTSPAAAANCSSSLIASTATTRTLIFALDVSGRRRQKGKPRVCSVALFQLTSNHRGSDRWTVYLSTEVPATGSAYRYMTTDPETSKPLHYENGWVTSSGPAVDLMVYHQRHCWLLFNSVCLNMAQCFNTKQSG